MPSPPAHPSPGAAVMATHAWIQEGTGTSARLPKKEAAPWYFEQERRRGASQQSAWELMDGPTWTCMRCRAAASCHPQEGCSVHPLLFCSSWLGDVLVGMVTVPTPHWDPTGRWGDRGLHLHRTKPGHAPTFPSKGGNHTSERSSSTRQGLHRKHTLPRNHTLHRKHTLPSTTSPLWQWLLCRGRWLPSPATSQEHPRTQHQHHPWTMSTS